MRRSNMSDTETLDLQEVDEIKDHSTKFVAGAVVTAVVTPLPVLLAAAAIKKACSTCLDIGKECQNLLEILNGSPKQKNEAIAVFNVPDISDTIVSSFEHIPLPFSTKNSP